MVEEEKKRVIRHRGLQTKVIKYLDEHVGLNLYLDDISKELEVPTSAIASTLSHIKTAGLMPGVEFVAYGVYRYSPQPKKSAPSAKMFEQIAVTKTGVLVLQDEDGGLYRAEELT